MRTTAWILLCALAAPGGETGKPRIVAIAPAEWVPALAPWVEARKRDLDVDAVALEDVLATNEGRDAPERIKRYLWRGWKERNLRYALLVGDADTFPVRFMVLDRCTPAAFDTAFYPSDLYYGDVAKDDGSFDDWNGKTDGHHAAYYGEVQGEKVKEPPINLDAISYVPEIAVGRWPVSNAADLAAVVAKTLAWDPSKRERKALVVHQDGWVDASARVGSWADALARAGWSVDRQVHGRDVAPTPASVVSTLKKGVVLALHSGHGEAWGWHGCLGAAEEKALADAPPAIYASAGCSTAVLTVQPPYDPYLDVLGVLHKGTNHGETFSSPPAPPSPLQPGRLERTSLGERLVRMPKGGAVAYFGCTTGSQPCGLTLLDGLALYDAGPRRLGDAWRFAIARYWREERLAELKPTADWYPPSIFFQGMKFILLGDPSLPLP